MACRAGSQLAIARALAACPCLLILADATGRIQAGSIKNTVRVICRLARRGVSLEPAAIVPVEQHCSCAAKPVDQHLLIERAERIARGRGASPQADRATARGDQIAHPGRALPGPAPGLPVRCCATGN